MAGSAYSASTYSANPTVAEINVTPLVDVMLVLLIIFMVTAPALTGNLNLTLPVPGPNTAKQPPRVELMVQQDGSFQLDGQSLTAGELPAALKSIVRAQPDTIVEVGANADADYQGFAHALSAAQESGVRNISTR
ncbi:ExbD/TolR family protein [Lysobacter sp. CA199]|uniref:ExbD/TolR family protein n=1 Tax=Lysobacter sp. CA199 TaxID=3455608 RepID=UPI003F8D17E0